MCGDSHLPAAPESGDLIAVIHPNPQSSFRGRLRLSNRLPGATASSLQCDTVDLNDLCNGSSGGSLSVRIQYVVPFQREWFSSMANVYSKYGQPVLFSSSADSGSESEAESEDEGVCSNPIMHSFVIDPATSCLSGGTRLNLGVGVDGVVGRTVSIFDRRRGRTLGQGVIGWN